MYITLPNKLKTTILQLFNDNKNHQTCAKAIASRIYHRYIVMDGDNINTISKAYLLLFIGRNSILLHTNKRKRETTFIIDTLILNNIIKKEWDACPANNSPAYYSLNRTFLYDKDVVLITEDVKTLMTLKKYKTFNKRSIAFINSSTYNKEINTNVEDLLYAASLTKLLKQRYLDNYTFNLDNVLRFIRKEWDDNTIKVLQLNTLKCNTYRQQRIAYAIKVILNPDELTVHVGSIGGRLHHQFCSMVKLLWLLIEASNLKNVKLSIDIKSCQVHCFLKYFGTLPLMFHTALINGTFYEYINDTFYNGKKTRDNIKLIVFSKFFNGKGIIWKYLKLKYPDYAADVLHKIELNNVKGYKTAGILQRMLSLLFNNLFKVINKSVIRYDEILVAVKQNKVDSVIRQISDTINYYYNNSISLSIQVNNLKYHLYNNIPYRAYFDQLKSVNDKDIQKEDVLITAAYVSEKSNSSFRSALLTKLLNIKHKLKTPLTLGVLHLSWNDDETLFILHNL